MITGRNRGARGGPPAQAADLPRLYAAEELALRIERRIAEQRMTPGDRLGTKAEVGDRYGFSGGTVNEAVILLETRGMVEARPGPGGGLFVAAPAPRVRLDLLLRELPVEAPRAADCLSLRNALEPPLCLDAARHCEASDAADLREILAAMRREASEPQQLRRSNWRLHRRIAAISANPLLRVVYLATLNLVEEATDRTPDTAALDGEQAVDVHEELVEALIAGQPTRLARAVERHDPLRTTTS
jgi:DNA-binding FadR family transcriptional regulator